MSPRSGQRGFTLGESIVAFALMGTAALGIVSMQRGLFTGQAANRDLLQATELMQECAERVLSVRRVSGYGNVTATPSATPLCTAASSCGSITAFGSFSVPTITLRDASNTAVCTCSSASCTVTVSISKGGTAFTPLTLQLQNY
ncbi:type II secretion system protein [Pelomonas sp. KK5]|uniref:type IV pilus modification PilV family protein n=1 Tax=Pelomonas sp. KK5 TaxID=1855730 RepID=UPI00097C64F1|nr:type II secretion system protein [Pelomonas sp. KK5]